MQNIVIALNLKCLEIFSLDKERSFGVGILMLVQNKGSDLMKSHFERISCCQIIEVKQQ